MKENRDKRLQVRATSAELELFKARAERAGYDNVSDWARARLLTRDDGREAARARVDALLREESRRTLESLVGEDASLRAAALALLARHLDRHEALDEHEASLVVERARAELERRRGVAP